MNVKEIYQELQMIDDTRNL